MGRKGYLIPPVDSVHELCDQLESIYGVRVNLKRSKLTLQGKTIGATETLASRGDSLEVEISDTSVYNLEHKRRQKGRFLYKVTFIHCCSVDVKNGVNEDVPIVDEGDIKAAMEKMKTSNPMDILNSFVDNDDVYKIFEDKEQMVPILVRMSRCLISTYLRKWQGGFFFAILTSTMQPCQVCDQV